MCVLFAKYKRVSFGFLVEEMFDFENVKLMPEAELYITKSTIFHFALKFFFFSCYLV